MNLEKIIAENMLRFGVKNLDQLQIENVIRLTELKDPAVEGTAKQVDAGKPTARWVWNVTCTWVGLNNTSCSVKGYCTSKDGQSGWTPQNLYINTTKENSTALVGMNYKYDSATGTYVFSTNNPTSEVKWEECYYSGPGNIPVNAVTAVLAAINKKCNASTKASAALSTGLQSMINAYRRTGTQIDAKYPLTGKWNKVQLSNPETDEAIGNAVLRPGTNATEVFLSAAGGIDETSKVSASNFSMAVPIKRLAAYLVATGTPTTVYGFASVAGKDKDTIKDQIIAELNRIAADSTITAAAPAPVDKK